MVILPLFLLFSVASITFGTPFILFFQKMRTPNVIYPKVKDPNQGKIEKPKKIIK
jgi:hypothetical protein